MLVVGTAESNPDWGDSQRPPKVTANAGDRVGNVVVGAGSVIDRIAAATGNPALQASTTAQYSRVVEQRDLAAVDQRQQVAIKIGLRRRRLLIGDAVLAELLDRPFAGIASPQTLEMP